MSGFISFVSSTFFFAVAFAMFLVHISSSRKKNRQKAKWWLIPTIVFAAIGITSGYNYFVIEPSEKQYVLIGKTNIELVAGEALILRMDIENGPGEVTVNFHDVTPKLRGRSNEKVLTYEHGEHIEHSGSQIKLTPHEKTREQWQFNNIILTQQQIDDLGSKMPDWQLFIFGKWEWIDESGIRHPFTFCYQYERRFPDHLANCGEDIKFK